MNFKNLTSMREIKLMEMNMFNRRKENKITITMLIMFKHIIIKNKNVI